MSEGGGLDGGAFARRRRTLGVIASIGLLVVAAVLAVVGGDGDGEPAPAEPAATVGEAEVRDLASRLGHPIYWAGEELREGEELELTEEADGSVYLRYLPPGVEAGDPRQIFLTIGTYPVAGAEEALRRTAVQSGVELERLEDGAVVLPNPSSPGSVYLVHPGSDLQIEVYHPEPGRAMELIRSGAIEPVGG